MTLDALTVLQQVLVSAGLQEVYIGDLPELAIDSIALRPVDGYPSTLYLGMPDTYEPLVEVLIRNTDFATGTNNSMLALKTLDNFSNTAVGILLAKVVGSPGYLGRNTEGFGEWHFIVHISLADNLERSDLNG